MIACAPRSSMQYSTGHEDSGKTTKKHCAARGIAFGILENQCRAGSLPLAPTAASTLCPSTAASLYLETRLPHSGPSRTSTFTLDASFLSSKQQRSLQVGSVDSWRKYGSSAASLIVYCAATGLGFQRAPSLVTLAYICLSLDIRSTKI